MITNAIASIATLAKQFGPQFIRIRQHFPKDTPFSSKEAESIDYITQVWNNFGLEGKQIAKNGVLFELQGNASSPIIALPINTVQAIGLGVIWVLNHFKDEIPGRIRFLFLPLETFTPEEAAETILKRAFENVNAVYGLYIDPSLPVGTVGIKFGAILPSKDTFSLRITGKAADMVSPNLAVDKIQVAAQIVTALNQLSARKVDPLTPVNISIHSIHSDDSNQGLSSILLQGLFRTLDREVQKQTPSLIESTVQGITRAYGAEYQLEFAPDSPILENDHATTMNLRMAAEEMLGKDKVINLNYPRMGLEDFAQYLRFVPGTLMHLGTGSKPTYLKSLQSNNFNIEEHSLETGVKVLSWALIRFFNSTRKS